MAMAMAELTRRESDNRRTDAGRVALAAVLLLGERAGHFARLALVQRRMVAECARAAIPASDVILFLVARAHADAAAAAARCQRCRSVW